jgi:hypothetical protein
VAFAPVLPAFYLPGYLIWPVVLVAGPGAMIAAVTRAYQDAARHREDPPAQA